MNWHEITLVLRMETLDILRDRRPILAMIVVPLLVYPVMIIVISQLGIAQVEKIRASKARVTVLPAAAAPGLVEAFRADTSFAVLDPEDPEADLTARKLDAIVTVPEDFERERAWVQGPLSPEVEAKWSDQWTRATSA